jgi:hypothetical protein
MPMASSIWYQIVRAPHSGAQWIASVAECAVSF